MAINAIEELEPREPVLTEVSAVYAAGATRVEVTVEPDTESQPFWLGERVQQPDWNVVKLGGLWFKPHLELPRGPGRREGERGRRMIPQQVLEDYARWRAFGEAWSLYRMTVTVRSPDRPPLTERFEGLAEHVVPLRSRALLDSVVAGMLGGRVGS